MLDYKSIIFSSYDHYVSHLRKYLLYNIRVIIYVKFIKYYKIVLYNKIYQRYISFVKYQIKSVGVMNSLCYKIINGIMT